MSTDADSRAQTYLNVLRHTSLDVDWKAFASELGISNTSNAQRKFREALKKDGLQMSSGKLIPLESNGKAKKDNSTPSSLLKRKKSTSNEAVLQNKKMKTSDEKILDEMKDESAEGEVSEERHED